MDNLECICLKLLSRTSTENPRSTLQIDVRGHEYILNLWDPWHEIGDYIEPYTKIRIFNVEIIDTGDSVFYSAGSRSIVVVDPDILINASSVGNISYCPRSYYISEIVGDIASPFVAIRGTIVHAALSSAIATNSLPSHIVEDVLENYALHFEQLGYSKNDMYQEVREMVESLDDFVDNLSPETIPESLFLSPLLGIRGRIDVLDESILELKTASLSPEENPRFSDSMQVSLYSYGLGELETTQPCQSGSVLYVGSGKNIIKEVNPNWGILRYAIQLRNIAYRISFLGYVPSVLPEEQVRKCEKCSVKIFCSLVCSGLKQSRECTKCNHEFLCSKKSLPENYTSYFNKFTRLIRKEKFESSRSLADLWNLKLEQRIDKGKTIADLHLETEINDTGLRSLIFSCENKSEIREGDIVILSDGQTITKPISTGVIINIANTSVEIETKAIGDSISVIDLYSIDVGFRRQQRGLFNLIFKRNNFQDVILESIQPEIDSVDGTFINNNKIQNEAIQKILGTKNYLLIQGPAGTGKTHVIAKAAKILANRGEKILLSAFTNRAVDNICEYLISNGEKNFIRLGSSYSLNPKLKEFSFDNILSRNTSKTVKELLEKIPIVVATTSTISSPIFENIGTQTIIMDEASQMTEPTALSALLEGDKFILVGDHKQLPPVVQSIGAKKDDLHISLFERLANSHPDSVHLLTVQFRMNRKLMDFSNEYFYANKLRCYDDFIASQNLLDLPNFNSNYQGMNNPTIYSPKTPLIFVPVFGQFNIEKKMNKHEAKVIADIVKNFLKTGIKINQIGVIAPYRGQVGEIRRYLPSNITVDTVDRFQGSDREVIILSLTESKSKSFRGFSDERRLNVAITRAKKKLIIVGDSQINNDILNDYTSYLLLNAELVRIESETKRSSNKKIDKPIIIADGLSQVARFIPTLKNKSANDTLPSKSVNKCLICLKPTYEKIIECPLCHKFFHHTHLIKWIEKNGRCPYCKTSLTLYSE